MAALSRQERPVRARFLVLACIAVITIAVVGLDYLQTHPLVGLTLRVYGHFVAGSERRAVAGIGEAIAAAQARRAAGEQSRE
jgi:hypothetical protein